jgi:ribosome-associated translation inhibitor RaiA
MIQPTAIEFHVDVPNLPDDLRQETIDRILELAEGHSDIISALVEIRQPAKAETSFLFAARVVLYMRPDSLAAKEKAETIQQAVKGAMDAIERQVRGKREKLRAPWKRPGMRGPEDDVAPPTKGATPPPEPPEG